MSLNNNLLEEKFFFAVDDAEYYDDTIELTVPYYAVIHQTMIDILNYHLSVTFGENFKNINGIVLDVGAGTGKESISVLNNFPNLNILAIDLCAPMQDIFERNYKAKFGESVQPRYKYVIDDITKISEHDEAITKYYDDKNQKGCRAAISAYCIHHFPLTEKKEVYQKMFDLLEPGGILINMDLFNYKSESVKTQAHNFDIEYIKREFDNPSPQFVYSRKIPLEKRLILKEKWVKHMYNDNILDSVEVQVEMLQKIGFKDVECVFKYWQQGVLIARK
jgi:tRNA (cmo5U34)-methyltransferase